MPQLSIAKKEIVGERQLNKVMDKYVNNYSPSYFLYSTLELHILSNSSCLVKQTITPMFKIMCNNHILP